MSREWKKTLIGPETSILEALRVVDDASLKVALVVDKTEKLLGVVTDGDVRRGLLSGVPLDDPVSMIMTPRPLMASVHDGTDFVKRLMLNQRCAHVPIVDEQGRVVNLVTLSELATESLPNWVVVMAGGQGKRLRPLTDSTPKPLITVGEQPLLETTVREMIDQGFRRFFVSINYMGDQIREHFGNGSRLGVEICYLAEEEHLGTAGALTLLPERPEHPLVTVVVNGDILTKLSFRDLLEYHAQAEATATMCISDYSFNVPYGVVQVRNGHLIGIEEKPTLNYMINAGVYVLQPEILDLIPRGEPYHMTTLFQRLIEERRNPVVFPIREYWVDVGRMDDLARASGDFRKIFG